MPKRLTPFAPTCARIMDLLTRYFLAWKERYFFSIFDSTSRKLRRRLRRPHHNCVMRESRRPNQPRWLPPNAATPKPLYALITSRVGSVESVAKACAKTQFNFSHEKCTYMLLFSTFKEFDTWKLKHWEKKVKKVGRTRFSHVAPEWEPDAISEKHAFCRSESGTCNIQAFHINRNILCWLQNDAASPLPVRGIFRVTNSPQ